MNFFSSNEMAYEPFENNSLISKQDLESQANNMLQDCFAAEASYSGFDNVLIPNREIIMPMRFMPTWNLGSQYNLFDQAGVQNFNTPSVQPIKYFDNDILNPFQQYSCPQSAPVKIFEDTVNTRTMSQGGFLNQNIENCANQEQQVQNSQTSLNSSDTKSSGLTQSQVSSDEDSSEGEKPESDEDVEKSEESNEDLKARAETMKQAKCTYIKKNFSKKISLFEKKPKVGIKFKKILKAKTLEIVFDKPLVTFKCPHPGCTQAFAKPQALGGHTSKAHPGASSTYQKKMEVRNKRTPQRENLERAKLIVQKRHPGLTRGKEYNKLVLLIKKELNKDD